MSVPTLENLMTQLERTNRYENWKTAVAQGWYYAKQEATFDVEKAFKLAETYFTHLEHGMKYLENTNLH